jgi:hypothetical protein
MRRVVVLVWLGLAVVMLLASSPRPSATAQDSVPATVAALQTTVAKLSTTVAGQATQISELQTAVAGQPASPVASPTPTPEPETLEITIRFRSDAENVVSDGLGSECEGAGRFRDLSTDADIGIYDIHEELLVAAEFVESSLIFEGSIFHECEMRFVIEEIPYRDQYIVGITHRSVLTYDYAELEEIEWTLELNFSS